MVNFFGSTKLSDLEFYQGTNGLYSIVIIVSNKNPKRYYLLYTDFEFLGIFRVRAIKGQFDTILRKFRAFDIDMMNPAIMRSNLSTAYSLTGYSKTPISRKIVSELHSLQGVDKLKISDLVPCFHCGTSLSFDRAKVAFSKARHYWQMQYKGFPFSPDYLCLSCVSGSQDEDINERVLREHWRHKYKEVLKIFNENKNRTRDFWDNLENSPLRAQRDLFLKEARLGFYYDPFDMLRTILDSCSSDKEYHSFALLIEKLSKDFALVYDDNFAYFTTWLLKIYYRLGQNSKIIHNLRKFEDDTSSIDEYFNILNFLLYLDYNEHYEEIGEIVYNSIETASKGHFIGDVTGGLFDIFLKIHLEITIKEKGQNPQLIGDFLTNLESLRSQYSFLNVKTEILGNYIDAIFGKSIPEIDIEFFNHYHFVGRGENDLIYTSLLDLLSNLEFFLSEKYQIALTKIHIFKDFLYEMLPDFLKESRKKHEISVLYPRYERLSKIMGQFHAFSIQSREIKFACFVELLPLYIEFLISNNLIDRDHKRHLLNKNTKLRDIVKQRIAKSTPILADYIHKKMDEHW